MNVLETINFTADKPAILAVRKTNNINVIAVGLLQNQLLKKHKTSIPTMLLVLKGNVEFTIEGEVIALKQYDTYQIPVNIEHEVKGLAGENCFLLTQEK